MKTIIYVEVFWILFSGIILGMMMLGAVLKLGVFTNMDFIIIVALLIRIVISIFWIQEEFKIKSSERRGK